MQHAYDQSDLLREALLKNNKDVLDQYLKDGGDTEFLIDGRDRLLVQAIEDGCEWAVDMLLAAGADIHKPSKRGDSLLAMACNWRAAWMTVSLFKAGARLLPEEYTSSALFNIILTNGYTEVVKDILESGRFSLKTGGGQSIWALVKKYRDVEILFDLKVRPDLSDDSGANALHYLSQEGFLDMIKILVSEAVDVNITDNQGNTPLMWAAKSGKAVTCGLLIKLGADVSITNKDGKDVWALVGGSLQEDTFRVLAKERRKELGKHLNNPVKKTLNKPNF